MSYAPYWKTVFGLDDPNFDAFLSSVGVDRPYDGPRLRKRALHRLRAEARARGLLSPGTPEIEEALDISTIAPLEWVAIGHQRELVYLNETQIRSIHNALVEDFSRSADPIDPPGVKSETYFASAVHRPRTANGGSLKYPTIEMAAGALLHAIVHNHPFHNGNKRTALVATLVFLDENGLLLCCNEDELFRLVLQLAQHALVSGPRAELPDREVYAVAGWIKNNARWVEKGERPMKWRALRQILVRYGCVFEYPSGVGNRINVQRTVTREATSIFGRTKQVHLSTQTHYGDEGRDVQPNTVNKLRRELEIDDDHGIDSRAFYDQGERGVGEFMLRYRKTLRRLARL